MATYYINYEAYMTIVADSKEEALEIFSIADLNESDEVNVTYVEEREEE